GSNLAGPESEWSGNQWPRPLNCSLKKSPRPGKYSPTRIATVLPNRFGFSPWPPWGKRAVETPTSLWWQTKGFPIPSTQLWANLAVTMGTVDPPKILLEVFFE